MNALGYLITRSLINSITHRLTRLRQPKYLIGAVLAGAYFYFYFYKFLFIGLGPATCSASRAPQMPSSPIHWSLCR